MGIYIPGMEIPKNCAECPCEYYECMLLGKDAEEIMQYFKGDKRHPDCPLVPVPDHNDRLIDVGEFEVVSYKGIPDGYEDTFDDGVLWMCEKIDATETIIPAEPPKEE